MLLSIFFHWEVKPHRPVSVIWEQKCCSSKGQDLSLSWGQLSLVTSVTKMSLKSIFNENPSPEVYLLFHWTHLNPLHELGGALKEQCLNSATSSVHWKNRSVSTKCLICILSWEKQNTATEKTFELCVCYH